MSRDSDTSQNYQCMKDLYKKRRVERYERNVKILEESGVNFVKLNPHHFRIGEIIDFWPSTGKWLILKSGKRGTGLMSLEKALESMI